MTHRRTAAIIAVAVAVVLALAVVAVVGHRSTGAAARTASPARGHRAPSPAALCVVTVRALLTGQPGPALAAASPAVAAALRQDQGHGLGAGVRVTVRPLTGGTASTPTVLATAHVGADAIPTTWRCRVAAGRVVGVEQVAPARLVIGSMRGGR